MQWRKHILLFSALCAINAAAARDHDGITFFSPRSDCFPLVIKGKPVPALIDSTADKGVIRAAEDLVQDFCRVAQAGPILYTGMPKASRIIIIGVVGQSVYLDMLVKRGKFDASQLAGKREKYIITTIRNPLPGIGEALVIAGSDKRGAIYGMYELSEQIGVSPWYWWADVPAVQHTDICIKRGSYTAGEPAVRYRGIFLNDEAPSLTGWVRDNYGGYNSKFYASVFELLLRLRGNFLWPAMWDAAFYDDDPANSTTADEYGIVIGTSHHEPMARAHKEWGRYGGGAWNYATNAAALDRFWVRGIERIQGTQDVVTIGMRGDGDEPMSPSANIALLERIVARQRAIIDSVTRRPAEQTPQVWALYKEVQEYYDWGMRVPDDVTLLLCDDNWGNVRKLPAPDAPARGGGYGMYYHFDYVGGPRNYKWMNVTPVQKIWEQMSMAWEHGVDRMWIVNVGDLKPMEYPITFFLDMAWNPGKFNENNLLQHTERFCAQQFGDQNAELCARLITYYTMYNRRATPELLDADTYSLDNYNEWALVVRQYAEWASMADNLRRFMPSAMRDALDELVWFPVQACANLNTLYYCVAKNRSLAAKGDTTCNKWADLAEYYFARDSLLTYGYNHILSGGKWNHMMDQTHIGYTSWQQPQANVMPRVERIGIAAAKPTASASRTTAERVWQGRLPISTTTVDVYGMGSMLPNTSQLNNGRQYVYEEHEGYVSIEAAYWYRAHDGQQVHWINIPSLGRTLSAITVRPSNVVLRDDAADGVWVEYRVDLTTSGNGQLTLVFSPSLNFNGNRGLRYAVSVDGGAEQVVTINGSYTQQQLERWQARSAIESQTTLRFDGAGEHTIRVRLLDTGLVLQKLILDMGGLKPSFLGAPSHRREIIE